MLRALLTVPATRLRCVSTTCTPDGCSRFTADMQPVPNGKVIVDTTAGEIEVSNA